jgi:AraC-like DNA-binding protein
MPTCETVELYRGAAIGVRDVQCREPVAPAGREQRAGGHHLVVTRRGVFVRHRAYAAHGGRAGGAPEVAEPTRVLLYNRHEPYRVSHPRGGGDACTVFVLDDATAHELTAPFATGRGAAAPFGVRTAPLSPPLLYRVQALRTALRRDEASALGAEEEALGLAAAILDAGHAARGGRGRGHAAPEARATARLADAVRVRLAAAPEQRHTLAALGDALGASPSVLARAFRARYGESIHQQLLRVRVGAALERLVQGATDLSTLALDLGFSSHGHFTTTFRRLVGRAPSEARRHLTGRQLRAARRAVLRGTGDDHAGPRGGR